MTKGRRAISRCTAQQTVPL